VVLQLKYFHQFQFAGYYAADYCGFYEEEGIRVDIREWRPGVELEQELVEGRATFLTYTPLILQRWAEGADFYLMAVIHQRNPHVLLVRSDSPWQRLGDITGLPRERLVAPATGMEVDLWIALSQLGHDPRTFFTRRKAPGDLERFIAGELDVLPGLLSNEPARLRKAGVAVRPLTVLPRPTVTPGDTLICIGQLARARPDLVERFRRASLRGWEYALSRPRELIEHILSERRSQYQPQDLDQLEQEAAVTAELIDIDRFTLGSINTERLESLADMLRDGGFPGRVPHELVHQPADRHALWLPLIGGILVLGCLALVALGLTYRRQQETLSETRTHYQNLLDAADGFIAFRAYITDDDGLRFDLASRSLQGILGYTLDWYQQSDRNFIAQVQPEDRGELLASLARLRQAGTGPLRLRLRMRHPHQDGERVLMLHATGMPSANGVALDGVLIDFTNEALAERQRELLQQQLQNAQRNESLGLLASGVAHDFNNILSAIRGNAELLVDQIPPSHKYRLDRLLQAVDRASGLVRQILAYSGRGRVESRPLDLAEELRQIDALIRHALPRTVHTVLSLEPGLPPVMFDPAQFQQVVVNLIVNAAESYNGHGGEVQVQLDRSQERIRLRVIDRGCGMDQATMARIFDPYFTTKEHGHGLGLAAVQGIIAGVSGRITCESSPGVGTTFTILLTPCASATARTIKSPLPELGDGVQYALVTDDDELVREITVETLTGLGYTCLQASGGQQCLDLVQREGPRLCLLVLDCRMPDLDGVTVLKRLRDQGNRLPVVLISGNVNVEAVGPLLRDRRTRFLAKPFSQNQLSATLDALFGSQSYRRRDHDSSRTAMMVADVIRQRNEENNRREAGSSQYRRKGS
jgi:signal transduction histidine kinase/CheY-like chemotaxis protein/ABC-type nitrate/sulfonate/bicarbonate transport system substrate-binding protein